MKSNTKTALLALTALVALPLIAAPALAKGGQGPHMSFETLDLNNDGSITAEELAGQHEARFQAADSNGDGKLSIEEMTAAANMEFADRMGARMEKMLERFDTDGDGELSLQELPTGRKGGDDRSAKMIDHLDTNDDGKIDAEEFAAFEDEHGDKGHHGKGRGDHGGFWR